MLPLILDRWGLEQDACANQLPLGDPSLEGPQRRPSAASAPSRSARYGHFACADNHLIIITPSMALWPRYRLFEESAWTRRRHWLLLG